MSDFANEIAGLSPKRLALLCLDLKAELDAAREAPTEPIAIIGMGCRLPGGVNNVGEFWRLLREGVDGVCEVPSGRWEVEAHYDANPAAPGKMYTRQGGFLERVDQFDPEFFGISPREARSMDPQQRLLLEVAWEALEHAGLPVDQLAGSQTGVFVGIGIDDYAKLQLKNLPASSIDAYTGTGNAFCFASGRLSYLLGVHGPSLALDTACSSSLVTIHLACQSLRSRECSLALAGGVNLMISPEPTIFLSKARALAPDGRCKTFDSAADGYGRGEGCGMVVLKRLSDALADGDNVHAVIRGSAVNHDGQSSGLTVPNGLAQQAVIRAALTAAGVEPNEVSYLEAHGTGTALGDPTEVRALTAVMGRGRGADQLLWIGSVKTNIGHLEVGAGVASVIKVALALEQRIIPPHLHFRQVNPHIAFDQIPARVPTTCVPWPDGLKPRVAGVSSFGLSGTNAHLVLAEAPARPVASKTDRKMPPAGPYLFALSARDPWSLSALAEACETALAEGGTLQDASLHDLCFTADVRRTHHPHRWADVVNSKDEIRQKLAVLRRSGKAEEKIRRERKLAFVFGGLETRSWPAGRELMEQEPVFLRALQECGEVFRRHGAGSILDELNQNDAHTRRTDAGVGPLTSFAFQVALFQLWAAWGVRPDAVIGHGLGEVAAAHVAGVLTLEDAARLLPWIQPETPAANHASNGCQMPATNGLGAKALDGFRPRAAALPIFSATTGRECDGAALDLSYWNSILARQNQFSTAIDDLIAGGHDVFLEIGPQPVLDTTITQRLQKARLDGLVLCSLRPGRAERGQMLESLGRLHQAGFSAEWRALYPSGGCVVQLPLYPWHRRRCWIDPEASDFGGVPAGHPLLGLPCRSPLLDGMAHQVHLRSNSGRYLADHRIHGTVLLPATAYLEMSARAGADALKSDAVVLENVVFQSPLMLKPDEDRAIQTVIKNVGPGSATFQVFSLESCAPDEQGTWTLHAAGNLRRPASAEPATPVSLPELTARYTTELSADDFYGRLKALGCEFGPGFRGLRKIWHAPSAALGRAELPNALQAEAGDYRMHPALLDACFHLMAATFSEQEQAAMDHGYLPAGIKCFRLHRSPGAEVWCEAVRHAGTGPDAESVSGDLRIYDTAGQLVAEVGGLWFRRVSGEALRGAARGEFSNLLYEVRWQSVERTLAISERTEEAAWLVFADRGGTGKSLAGVLRARGETCELVFAAPADGNGFENAWVANPASAAECHELLQRLHAAHKNCCGIIYLWGLDENVEPAGSPSMACGGLLHLFQALGGAGWPVLPPLWVVTRGSQPVAAGDGPLAVAQAPLWGMKRVIALENPELRCICLDLDPNGKAGDVSHLVEELSSVGREDQIGLRGDRRYAPRLHRRPALRVKKLTIPGGESFQLDISKRGILENLVLRGTVRRPPGPGEVEIRINATGLNFKDVMNALGLYPGDAGPLGSECAGEIAATGPGVRHLRCGDAVIAFAPGSFGRYVTTSAEFVVPKPARLSFAEGATIPIAFVTAGYALNRLARLAPGERILIHAASGGVGLAAVQLAQQAGAEIFATAGSPRKRAYLRSLGIGHIMDSRSLNFAGEIKKITGGEGVDVVLNSLAGDFIKTSLALVRRGGRFLEIGKTGILSEGEAARLRPDVSYHTIALDRLTEVDASAIGSMLKKLSAKLERGDLKPLPQRVFAMEHAVEAFRFMAQAKHIGKVIVSPPETGLNGSEPPSSPRLLKADSTYLITGGLGALGLMVARWMVREGARNLVLMGRSSPSANAAGAVRELNDSGARVIVMQGDVAKYTDVAGLLAETGRTMPPLRGVIHAAGVLEDGMLEQQPWDRFVAALPAKMQGAWNLHTLTQSVPLDFFVLFSSVASVFGSPGQGNYAAANAFLDALAHHRRALGLAALAVNWGPWADTGFAAKIGARGRDRWAAQGVGLFPPELGLGLLGHLLRDDSAQAMALAVEWPKFVRRFPLGQATPFFAAMAAETSLGSEAVQPAVEHTDLRRRLKEARPQQAHELLRDYLRSQVAQLLGFDPSHPLDTGQGLLEMGMDSLMAVDFRNRLLTALGGSFSPTVVFDHPTIDALTKYLAREMIDAKPAPAELPKNDRPELPEALQRLEELSEEEAEAYLAAKLKERNTV